MTAVDPLSNPTAVYGLRLLVASYAGALVTLRRSTDNTTQSFAADANGNFPVAAAVSFAAGSLLYVSAWFDQSGNGNHATQSNTANQPVLSPSVFSLNGLPSILFGDGSARNVQSPASATLDNFFSTGGMVSGVVQFAGVQTGNAFIVNKGNITRFGPQFAGPARQELLIAASTTSGAWSSARSSNVNNVIDVRYSYASLANVPAFAYDGVVQTTFVVNTQPVGAITSDAGFPLVIGASNLNNQNFPGYISELIIARSYQTDAQMQTLRSNQLAYWQETAVGSELPLDAMGKTISQAAVQAGGTGFAVGDFVFVGNATTLQVTAVTSTVITTIALVDGGNWLTAAAPSNPVAQTATTGSGTGATFNLTLAAALAAFGNILLTAAYTANKCLDLTRASDSATITLGFINGVVDMVAGDAFARNDQTTTFITKWYDQSGAGNHAAQSTTANAPLWSPGRTVGGIRPVMFNSRQFDLLGTPDKAPLAIYLTIGAGLSWTPGATTWAFVGVSQSNQPSALAGTTDNSIGFSNAFVAPCMCFEGSATGRLNTFNGATGNTWLLSTPATAIWQWQGGFVTGYSNNAVAIASALGAQSPITGATIGTSVATNAANYDATVAIICTSTTVNQVRNLNAALMNSANLAPFANSKITLFVDGDSYSMGRGSLLNNSQYSLALPSMKKTCVLVNNAVSGRTLAGIVSVMARKSQAYYSTDDSDFFIGILEAGVNDIRGAATLAQVQASFLQYVTTFKSMGPNTRVFVCTTPLQTDVLADPTLLSEFKAFTNWLRFAATLSPVFGGLGADGLIDYFSDPLVGANSFSFSPLANPIYSRDGKHPTDQNMLLLAPYVSGAVNALLFPQPPVGPLSFGGSSGLAYGRTYDRKIDEEDEEALLVLLN